MATIIKACSYPALSMLMISLMFSPVSAEPIHLFYNAQQKPKAWIDEHQQPRGFAYEIAAAILQTAKIAFIPKAVPFNRGINSTKLCDGIMTGVFKTKVRQTFFNYSLPIVADRAVVISRANEPIDFQSINDLLKHKVVYLHGASFGNEFERIVPQLKKVTHQNPAMMLRLLVRKRVDLVILNPGIATVEFAAKTANIDMQALKIASIPLAEVDNYLVTCNTNPKFFDPIIKKINAAIKQLKNDGSLQKIMARY